MSKIARLINASKWSINYVGNTETSVAEGKAEYNAAENFEDEKKEAFTYFDEHIKRDEGYWQLLAHPFSYNGKLIENPVQGHQIVQKSTVHLRGWNFPHDDSQGNSTNFLKGRQSFTTWEGYHYEAWRMYKSGLFIWREYYMDDLEGFSTQNKNVFSFINVIYSLTEYLLFLKRLNTEFIPVDSIHLEFKLTNCKGRKLESLQPGVHIWDKYVSGEEVISIERDLNSVELQASATMIAREMTKEVFMLFNWNDPADGMIEDWQKKLIEKGGV